MKKVSLSLLLVAAVVLLGPPASGQQYPPTACQLTASPSSVTAGSVVTVATTGCPRAYAAGAQVTITLTSDPVVLAAVTAGGDGHILARVTIPGDTTQGTHTLTSSGPGAAGGTLVLKATIQVSASGAPGSAFPPQATLARTGSPSALVTLVWISVVALTLGGALVIGNRRLASTKKNSHSGGSR